MHLGESRNQSEANHKFRAEQEKYWHDSLGSTSTKLQNFTKYVRREDLTKFLARNDVFVSQLHVHGSVIDIGVGRGASLITWLHLSSIYEPSNYTRKVVGFDTFTGIPRLSSLEESAPAASEQLHIGGFAVEEHMTAWTCFAQGCPAARSSSSMSWGANSSPVKQLRGSNITTR